MKTRPIRILLVANTAWYLYRFRIAFAKYLKESGYDVILLAPASEYSKKLRDEGFRVVDLPIAQYRINPLAELATVFKIAKLYIELEPDLIHHHTLKAVLYGTLAGWWKNIPVPIINSFTGKGFLYHDHKGLTRLVVSPIRTVVDFFLSRAFRKTNAFAIFQNDEDVEILSRAYRIDPLRARAIAGSGVEIKPTPASELRHDDTCRIAFIGRILRDKGILEFIDSALANCDRHPEGRTEFWVIGSPPAGHPLSVKISELEARAERHRERFRFLGHVDEIDSIYRQVDVVVLPSYQEGVPRVLLEAAAARRSVIATDIPGCRAIIQTEKSGILVRPKNVPDLADAIDRLAENADLRRQFAEVAYEKVKAKFDVRIINSQTAEIYERMLGLEPRADNKSPARESLIG